MGIILPQTVMARFCGKQKIHLQTIGYNNAPYNSLIEVNVNDLLPRSTVIVKAICDYCGNEYETAYYNITSLQNSSVKKSSCKYCKHIKCQDQKRIKTLESSDINPLYWDKSWLEQQYILNDLNANDIAILCGVNARRIREYIERFRLYKFKDHINVLNREFLIKEYVEELKTIYQISSENRFTPQTVKNMLIKYDIHIRSRGEYMGIYYDLRGGREITSTNAKIVWNSSEFREKHLEAIRKAITYELRKKMSAQRQGIPEDEWDDFATNKNTLARKNYSYRDWRNSVFTRDNFTCQCCGARSSKGSPVILHAHHIENFSSNNELRLCVDNGITMCKHCHSPQQSGSFHSIYGTKNNNREQLDEYIRNHKTEKSELYSI